MEMTHAEGMSMEEQPVNKYDLGIIEGRIVHYVMENGKHRPALIVNAWRDSSYTRGEVNLLVFLDGRNDGGDYFPATEITHATVWKTSVPMNADTVTVKTWHFIER